MVFKEKHLNPNWNGGKTKRDGYIYILKHFHPRATQEGYVPEHVLVMEDRIGRYLSKAEIVHHVNGIKDDNRIENLELMESQSEHARRHRLYELRIGRRLFPNADKRKTVQHRKKLSDALVGKKLSQRHRAAISDGLKKWWASRQIGGTRKH